MNEWELHFITYLNKGAVDSGFLGSVDSFLMWFSSFPDVKDDELTTDLLVKFDNESEAKSAIYQLIDDVFFRRNYLFHGCKGDSKAIKTRYFRLMQLYHPDRADRAQMEQAWMTRRCELINSAYAVAKSELKADSNQSVPQKKTKVSPEVKREANDLKVNSGPSIKVNLGDRLQAQKKVRLASLRSFFKRKAMQVTFSTSQLRNRVVFLLLLLSMSTMGFLYWNHYLESQEIAKIGFTYESASKYLGSRSLEEEIVHSNSIDDLMASPKPPITLDSELAVPTSEVTYDDRILVESLLSRWSDAWSNRDFELYLSFYGQDFMPKESDSFNRWRSKRKYLLNNKKFIRVRLRDLVLSKQDNAIKAEFLQYYLSDTMADKVRKELVLVQEKNDWKIVSERVN